MKHFEIFGRKDAWTVLEGTDRSQVALMTIPPGDKEGSKKNTHTTSDQWLFVISGEGWAWVEGQEVLLKPGSLILIEANERHEIRNSGKLLFITLNFYAPPAY